MKSYFNALNDREKWMIIGTGLCLVLYLYYLFLYSPLNHSVTQKSAQLVDKVHTLQWMNNVRQQNHTTPTKQIVNNSQLLTALATQLKNDPSLKFTYELQQTSSGDIQLTFDTVVFNFFMVWLEKMSQQYAISVKQFEADRTKVAGMTRLMILISSTTKAA